MKFYLLNNNEQLVRIIDTEEVGSAQIIPVYEAKHHMVVAGENSLTLVIPGDHPDAELFEEGNCIAYQDMYNPDKWYSFNILRSKMRHNSIIEKEIYCEHTFLDLLYEPVLDMSRRTTAEVMLGLLINNTRWQMGFVSSRLKVEIHNQNYVNMNTLLCIRTIEQAYDCEAQFRVYYNQEQNRLEYFVDLFDRIGVNRGKAFEFEKDIESVEREVDLSRVYTAVYGFGKYLDEEKADPNNRVTFKDVEWSVENGNPVDKPLGLNIVRDEAARERYGLYGGMTHRFGILDDERFVNPANLLEEAWSLLQANNKPYVSYQTKVIDLYRTSNYDPKLKHERVEIGDTVTVIDHYFKPAMIEEVRAVEMTIDLLNPMNTDLILGNKRRDGLGGSGGGSGLGGSDKLSSGGSGSSTDTGDRVKHATIAIQDEEMAYNYNIMSDVLNVTLEGIPSVPTGHSKYKVLIVYRQESGHADSASALAQRFVATPKLRQTFFPVTISTYEAQRQPDDWLLNWNLVINISTESVRANDRMDWGSVPVVTSCLSDFGIMNGIDATDFYLSYPGWDNRNGIIKRTIAPNDLIMHEVLGHIEDYMKRDEYQTGFGPLARVTSLIPQSHFEKELVPMFTSYDDEWDADSTYANRGYAGAVSDKSKIIQNPRGFLGTIIRFEDYISNDGIEIMFGMGLYLLKYFGREPVDNGYDASNSQRTMYVDYPGHVDFMSTAPVLEVENDSYVPSYKMNPTILFIKSLTTSTIPSDFPAFYSKAIGIKEMDGKEVTVKMYKSSMTDEELSQCTVIVTDTGIESIKHKFRNFAQFIVVNSNANHQLLGFGEKVERTVTSEIIRNVSSPSYSTVDKEGNTVHVYYDASYEILNLYSRTEPLAVALRNADLYSKTQLDTKTRWYMQAYDNSAMDVYGNQLGESQAETYFYPVISESRKTISPNLTVLDTERNDRYRVMRDYAALVLNESANSAFIQIDETKITADGLKVVDVLLKHMIRRITKLGDRVDATSGFVYFEASEMKYTHIEVEPEPAGLTFNSAEAYVTVIEKFGVDVTIESSLRVDVVAGTPRISVQQNLSDSHNILILYNPNNALDVMNASIVQNECNKYLWSSELRPITTYRDYMETHDLNTFTAALMTVHTVLELEADYPNYTANTSMSYVRRGDFLPTVLISDRQAMGVAMSLHNYTDTVSRPDTIYFQAQLDNPDHITGRYLEDPSVSNPVLMLNNTSQQPQYFTTISFAEGGSFKRIAGDPALDAETPDSTTRTAYIWESTLAKTVGFGYRSLQLLSSYEKSSQYSGMKLLMGALAYMGQHTIDTNPTYKSYTGVVEAPEPNADNIEVDFIALSIVESDSAIVEAYNVTKVQLGESPVATFTPADPLIDIKLSPLYRRVLYIVDSTYNNEQATKELNHMKANGFFHVSWEIDVVAVTSNLSASINEDLYDFAIIPSQGSNYQSHHIEGIINNGLPIPTYILNTGVAVPLGYASWPTGYDIQVSNTYSNTVTKAYKDNPAFWDNVDLLFPGMNFSAGMRGGMDTPVIRDEDYTLMDTITAAASTEWMYYGLSSTQKTSLILTAKETTSKGTYPRIILNMGKLIEAKSLFPAMHNTARNMIRNEAHLLI